MTEFEVRVHWTRSGAYIDSLDDVDWSYDESIAWSELGKGSVTSKLGGRVGRVNRPLLKAMERETSGVSVCIARDGRALWAGPVLAPSFTNAEVRFGLASIGRIMDSRILIADDYWGRPTDPRGNLHFELGPRDLAIELLRQGITGHQRDLPLVLPAPSANKGPVVDYLGSELASNYDRIKEVCDRDDGPDVLISAELYDDGDLLRWVVDVGGPSLGTAKDWQPDQPLPTWDWPTSITEWDGDTDGAEEVSTGYVPGDTRSGSDTRLIGVAVRDRGPQRLALERVDRTSVSEARQAQLDALAASYIAVHAHPTRSWTITVHPEHPPLIGAHWTLGDAGRVQSDGSHGWFDEQRSYDRRMVAVSHARRKLQLITTDGAEVGMPRWTG